MTIVCWSAITTWGRKLVWRALVLVKATTHVLCEQSTTGQRKTSSTPRWAMTLYRSWKTV